MNTFLSKRQIPWMPAKETGQDVAAEMRQFLEQAHAKFHDAPALLKGLKAYQEEVAGLLEDN